MEERLQKFLARAGVASRRAAEVLIAEGHVAVNGVVVRRMGTKIDPATDEVRVDTEVVRAHAPALRTAPPPAPGRAPGAAAPVPLAPSTVDPSGIYLLLNKPAGFLTTSSDDRGRKTVMDLLPRLPGRVFPVGRLDEDSEGLLLLTNDGTLAQLLTHPRYGVAKTYDLRIRGTISEEDARKVERGVWLSEGRTGPARIRVKRSGRDISHVFITLREGRNREVRRIFARLRHPVLSLRRIAVGPLELEGLRTGEIRRLAPREVKDLYRAALEAKDAADTAPRPASPRPPRPARDDGPRGSRPPRDHRPPREGRPRREGGPSRGPRPSNPRGGRPGPDRRPRRGPSR